MDTSALAACPLDVARIRIAVIGTVVWSFPFPRRGGGGAGVGGIYFSEPRLAGGSFEKALWAEVELCNLTMLIARAKRGSRRTPGVHAKCM